MRRDPLRKADRVPEANRAAGTHVKATRRRPVMLDAGYIIGPAEKGRGPVLNQYEKGGPLPGRP